MTERPRIVSDKSSAQFVALIADDREILSVGGEHSRWNAATAGSLANTTGSGLTAGFALAPDKKTFAVGNSSNVEVRDTNSLQLLRQVQTSDRLRSIAISDNGDLLAARCKKLIALYRYPSLELVREIPTSIQGFNFDIVFLPDGKIATAADDGVAVIDPETAAISKLECEPSKTPQVQKLHRNGERLFALRSFDYAEFDLATGQRVSTRAGQGHFIFFAPRLQLILLGEVGGVIQVLDYNTGTLRAKLCGHAAAPNSMSLSADGRWLVSCQQSGQVRLWDLEGVLADPEKYMITGDELASCDYPYPAGIAFREDGQGVVSARRGQMDLWSDLKLRKGRAIPLPAGQNWMNFLGQGKAFGVLMVERPNDSSRVGAIAVDSAGEVKEPYSLDMEWANDFSAVNRRETIGAVTKSENVVIFDYRTGRILQTLGAHANPGNRETRVTGLSFGPDDEKLTTSGTDGFLRIWNATTGSKLFEYGESSSNLEGFGYSADRSLLAYGWNQTVMIMDTKTNEIVEKFSLGMTMAWPTFVFSPDKQLLAIASAHRGEFHVIRWRQKETIATLNGHIAGVTHLAYSPDAKHLASASYDNTIKIWKAPI